MRRHRFDNRNDNRRYRRDGYPAKLSYFWDEFEDILDDIMWDALDTLRGGDTASSRGLSCDIEVFYGEIAITVYVDGRELTMNQMENLSVDAEPFYAAAYDHRKKLKSQPTMSRKTATLTYAGDDIHLLDDKKVRQALKDVFAEVLDY